MTTQITTPPPAERAEQEAQQRAMYARKAEMDRMASTIETERLRQMEAQP